MAAQERLLVCPGTVQQQAKLVGPYLRVAGHRFVIEPQVFGQVAEEHVGHAIFTVGNGQLVLVAMDAAPTMRPPEHVAVRALVGIGDRVLRMWFVHPARLRHPQAKGIFPPRKQVEQGNLHGQGQFAAQLQERRLAPEHERAGKGQ